MSEERVARNTHTMVQRLEDLRIEHMSLINSLESPKTEKSDIILKNIKSIDVGLDEAQLMMEFTYHLQNVEIEKQKSAAQIKQLTEENDNLRGELAAAQEKLRILERMITREDGDRNMESTTSQVEKSLDISYAVSLITSDNFEETIDYDSDSTITSSGSNQIIDFDESKALSCFTKAQSLAIRYASEGNYEVALPLCQQAIDDLNKTTVGRSHPYIKRMLALASLVYGIQNKYNKATKILHDAIREKIQPLTFSSD